MTFSSLGLLPSLLQNLAYSAPSPAQLQAIPAILSGGDVRLSAQTGSGKTAAFALPLLHNLAGEHKRVSSNSVRALVLVPTRELADQVQERMRVWSANLSLSILAVYGGVSINPQMKRLRPGVDVLVATPGRLLDLLEHNVLSLSALSVLVLDEADRLLDQGFAEEMGRILACVPTERQTVLVSATFPASVRALAEQVLREPSRIEVQALQPDAPAILQRAIEVDGGRRGSLLRYLIKEHGWERVLVFVASKHAAGRLAGKLCKAGTHAAALHGDLSQEGRAQVLAEFKASEFQVLVATDLAARGIDIEQLPAVVNYDLPRSPNDYTHRIGRTGRAGASGVAVSFLIAGSEAHFRLIEKRQNLSLPRERILGFEPLDLAPAIPVSDSTGGIKGKRKSKKDKLREAAKS